MKTNKTLHLHLWASKFPQGYGKFLHEDFFFWRGKVCQAVCYTIFISIETTPQGKVCFLKGVKDILNLR